MLYFAILNNRENLKEIKHPKLTVSMSCLQFSMDLQKEKGVKCFIQQLPK